MGYRFAGFDLVDEVTMISALTNCGGFEGAFESSDLSEIGLIEDISRAYEIRGELLARHPEERHACCTVWAIWEPTATAAAAS